MRRGLLILMTMAALAAVADVALGALGTYKGTTDQDKAFTLTVTPDGARFGIDWSADCGDGGKPFQAHTSSQRALPLRAGSFSSRESYDATASDQAKVHYVISIVGHV